MRYRPAPRRCVATVIVLLACIAGLTGCGRTQVTRQDVIARGNAICAGALRTVRAIPAPAGGESSPADLSAYLRQVAPIVEKEAKDLEALPRPAKRRTLLDRYLSAVAAEASQYHALAAAARANNSAGVAQALANLRASPAASLAAEYGLTQCAAPGSTAVS
jgi:hypothetical protein